MAFELKEGQGSLFKNERREKDTHPHAKGTALIAGVAYWVSAWTKEGKGGKFQSLSFTPKESFQKPAGNLPENRQEPAQKPQASYREQSGGRDDYDADLPF